MSKDVGNWTTHLIEQELLERDGRLEHGQQNGRLVLGEQRFDGRRVETRTQNRSHYIGSNIAVFVATKKLNVELHIRWQISSTHMLLKLPTSMSSNRGIRE
jgi:hypothetical protein